MIRHLLEGSKALLLFLILFSCQENKREKIKEYSYPRILIKENLKREIYSYKQELNRLQASKSNNLSIYFSKKNDTTFVEIGDYKPNLKILNIKGVEIMKKDTIYLFSGNDSISVEQFYENQFNDKINIIDNLEPSLNHFDPHFKCLYIDNENLKVLFYGRCK
ncbi:hypothetical protein CLU97_1264 [Chryseobacterium sp. 7]|uniref:hypothetical protein n=1 Tax=Chryseobacterium sp. 7 TaxID=2035214 RepID=UPI000EB2DD0C|nr:hypothetical protein [Chryseobacterium sp. 7]RLJ31825.1 hypothetical protein CLU97_1264 [Chryseobacterium sp. 7]